MRRELREKVIEHLSNFHISDKILFEDFITGNCDELLKLLPQGFTSDVIYDSLVCVKSIEKDIIIDQLKKHQNKKPHKNNYEIILDAPFYYLTPTIYSKQILSGNKKKYSDKLNFIATLEKEKKGIFYENFCTLFLEDMGLISERTKTSGDKGIDILAHYSINLPNKLSNFFLDENIYLLAQAKFYKNRVDTPTIRKLVGDSLFIRFDRLDYLQIAHNAVHLAVFSHSGYTKNASSFAKKNKVLLFTSEDILDFVCNENNPNIFKCINYLLNYS